MSKSQEIQWLLKEKYGGVMSDMADIDINRIKAGEPVAYVIGFVDFLGYKIDLSQRTLIPRPETEFWVEQAIEAHLAVQPPSGQELRCLDVFAGSGCIGVAMLKKITSATVDFADIDDSTVKQVEINCKINNIDQSRYRIIKSDMFEHIGKTYDYIFANPPYVAESKMNDVQESVIVHEPHIALFGGSDGLLYIKSFLEEAPKHLNPGGKIYTEFDSHQKDDLEKILKTKDFNEINFYQDQFKKWRYLVLEQ